MTKKDDFQCRYCTSVFSKRAEKGACPCCGAPNPKRLETMPNVAENYRYITYRAPQNNAVQESYYMPTDRSLKSKVYSTLGFKFVTGILLTLAALLVYSFIHAFDVGTPSELTNTEMQRVAPTVMVVNPAVQVQTNWLETEIDQWLTSTQSLDLRERQNVVNLVVLGPDEVKFASNTTLQLDDSWVQTKPYFVEGVSVDGSKAIVEIGGIQYKINTYMPFVSVHATQTVVIIDADGLTWEIAANNATLIPINAVELPISIEPNANLQIAFSKQQ